MSSRPDPADSVYDAPIYVQRVQYDGIRRTKHSALDQVSKHIFGARTLRELVNKCYSMKTFMEDIALFKKVDVSIEPDKYSPLGVQVIYSVVEPSRFKAMANATMDETGQLHTGVELSSMSLSGRGDMLRASVAMGRDQMSMFDFHYARPLLRHPGSFLGGHVFRNFRLFPQCSGVSVESGVSADFRQQLTSKVAYAARLTDSWRFFNTNSSLFLIREHAGHSVKVSFEHSLELNTEDDKVLPTTGTFLKIAQEFARFWGDAVFTKYQLDIKRHMRLPFGFFSTYGCSLVHISPEATKGLSFMDRTFLGGASNLRGFVLNSVGDSIGDGLYLGGSGSVCVTAHLFRCLIDRFLYAHLFACAGNIWHSPYSNPISKAWQELSTRQRRSSAGVGLVLKLGNVARVEANYCMPIEFANGDKLQKGFQIGVGTFFL